MRLNGWLTFGLAGLLLAGDAAAGDETGVRVRPGLYAPEEHNDPVWLGLYDTRHPVAPTPVVGPTLPGPPRRGASARPQRLGPIQKLRRGRYVLSRLKELKAGRVGSAR